MARRQVRPGRAAQFLRDVPLAIFRGREAPRFPHPWSALARASAAIGIVAIGCAFCGVSAAHAQALFDRRPTLIDDPQPQRFSVCYGHTCSVVVTASLPQAAWQRVRVVFHAGVDGPEDERTRIASAIALLETLVGEITGTARDLGGDVRGFLKPGQMDCVDEANNSTTYLKMFAADGLLKWHEVGPVVKRGHILFGMPHATAIITDKTTREQWAVDSWYLDNGEPPYIVPYRIWKDGWSPPEK